MEYLTLGRTHQVMIIAHNYRFDEKYFTAIMRDQLIQDKYDVTWIDSRNLVEKVVIQHPTKGEKLSHKLGELFLDRFSTRKEEYEKKAHQSDFDVEMLRC